MFDEIDPNSNAFESLKSFCTRIGEGRLQPVKEETHFHILNHPVVVDEKIMIIYESSMRYGKEGRIGLSEAPPEGAKWEEKIFYYWPVGEQIFPDTATLDRQGVTLGFSTNSPNVSKTRKVSHHDYRLLEMLFDSENPFPWIEIDERKPRKLDDTYLPS